VLRELRSDAAEAITEIRRIVHGLRPKALDELGLVAAVAQRVSRLRAADGRIMQVNITTPNTLPELPAALEVVAYRVAVEAVTNVARHSGVAEALVTITTTPGQVLSLTVEDQGRSPEPWRPGVGLKSMRERVEQIGGTLDAHASPNGGERNILGELRGERFGLTSSAEAGYQQWKSAASWSLRTRVRI
jgi:signal transduction histidine kinase